MDVTTLGARHERSFERSVKKARGVYYTPPVLARYMVERTLGVLLRDSRSTEDVLKIRIHDPACGAGYFLIAAYELLLTWCSSHFGESSRELRNQIQRQCLFGSDIDAEALAIARAQLPYANFVRADALTLDASHFDQLFDVVVGNPPYGAELDQKGDSTRLFMHRAQKLLSARGLHAFIVPKSLLYSSTWHSTLEKFMPGIYELVDCGKVWPEVKLEQVIYFYAGAECRRDAFYRSCLLEGNTVRELGQLDRASFSEFGFALNGISNEELLIGRRMRNAGASLNDFISNQRGAPLQASLATQRKLDALATLGGKQIERYGLAVKPKGYCAPPTFPNIARARINPGSILVQNIVAHVLRPEPQLKIIATLPPANCQSLILDTVNQLTIKSRHAPEFFLGILNSRIMAWYIYRFVVGRAVRTIHFDSPLTARIPMPAVVCPELHDALAARVREMLKGGSQAVDEKIELLVLRLFDLEKGVARAVRGIGV